MGKGILYKGASVVLMVLGVSHSHGLSLGYSFITGIEYSDNLTQIGPNSGIPEESGRVVNGGVDFFLNTEQNSVLEASVSGSFIRNRYSLDELSSDDQKEFIASLLFQPEGRNFRLGIFNSLEQVKLDRTSGQSINNIRDINTLNINPSYFIRLSSVSNLTTDLGYTEVKDDDGFSSSEAMEVTIGYQVQVLSDLSWSINGRKRETEFADTEEMFEQDEVFFRIENSGSQTLYELEFGRQRTINAEDELGDYAYQNLVRLSLVRQINISSNLNFQYRQGFGDVLNLDLGNSIVQVSSNDQAGFIEGVVEERQASLGYGYNYRNFNFIASLGTRSIRDDDEVVGNTALIDENSDFISLEFRDQLFEGSSRFSAFGYTIGYRHDQTDFNLSDQYIKSNQATFRLTFQHSAKAESFLEFTSRNASGDGPSPDFDEERVAIGVRFSPRGLF